MVLAGQVIRATDVPGALTPYTPVITGVSSGTWVPGATVITANYIRHGDKVEVWVDLALGAGVSITGSITTQTLLFSLPVAAHASIVTPTPIGEINVIDTGTGGYAGIAVLSNSTTFFMRRADTFATMQSNTITFASTDRIGWHISYMAA